jgi:hypothetical protein
MGKERIAVYLEENHFYKCITLSEVLEPISTRYFQVRPGNCRGEKMYKLNYHDPNLGRHSELRRIPYIIGNDKIIEEVSEEEFIMQRLI